MNAAYQPPPATESKTARIRPFSAPPRILVNVMDALAVGSAAPDEHDGALSDMAEHLAETLIVLEPHGAADAVVFLGCAAFFTIQARRQLTGRTGQTAADAAKWLADNTPDVERSPLPASPEHDFAFSLRRAGATVDDYRAQAENYAATNLAGCPETATQYRRSTDRIADYYRDAVPPTALDTTPER